MKVLVAFASRHGSTKGIAERIATTLTGCGHETTLRRADEVGDMGRHDAFVIGGSAYFFHWAKEPTRLVRRNAPMLSRRPTWLFSSGPLGTDKVDAQGRDALAAAVPREFAELEPLIQPRGVRIFFGAHDPTAKPVGVLERITRMMPAARDALPAGDFRDWIAIDEWARGIGAELAAAETGG